MLTRSIDLDPFDLTIEEKIFRGAKRICIVFVASAMTLSAFDLANIRTAESAAEFIHENRVRLSNLDIAELPVQIRAGIERMSFTSDSPSVTVAIPRDNVATRSRPAAVASVSIAIKNDGSPVVGVSAARHQDAIEVAMSPPAFTKAALRVAAEPAQVATLRSAPLKFASADRGEMPTSAISPVPESLPMSTAIPLDMVPIPRPAPGVPPPSPAERLHLEGKERAKAERYLANAIYFESRSEPVRGQMAVAQVVINRAFSGFYPNDICGVVYQNARRHLACQFTFACDGKRKIINERGAWARTNRIAKQTLDGQIYVPEVVKSTHYHAIYVHPNWVREMKKMVRYGIHNFYRPIALGQRRRGTGLGQRRGRRQQEEIKELPYRHSGTALSRRTRNDDRQNSSAAST